MAETSETSGASEKDLLLGVLAAIAVLMFLTGIVLVVTSTA